MARARTAQPVKLIAGLLSGDEDLLRRAQGLLARRFGEIQLESETWPFDETDYYQAEMGPHLKRRFVSFAGTIRPDLLAEVKRETNALEARITEECNDPEIARPVNIDPGYLDLGKLVLATTKDRSHRVYIGLGIFAEVTLHYQGGGWQAWPWTYSDYQRPEYHAFFQRVRESLHAERAGAGDEARAADESQYDGG